MPSIVIRHVHYNPAEEALSIWFTSGRRYRYSGVPQVFYDALVTAPSRGRFFNRWIKGKFACASVPDRHCRATRRTA